MHTDRWREIETLFSAALAQPPAARRPFVERHCADAGMRAEVVSLLEAADASRDFLSSPALDAFARQVSREGWTVRVGDRLGAYTITARIGAGGMGEVWRARDERLGRDVAIKLLLPHAADLSQRASAFEREARAAGALNHPNLLTVHDVGDHRGAPFIVMQCLDGESLRARQARDPLPLDAALHVALQVARGLAAAHARGIVHRDLKPENIFLTADGGVKLVDFGIAALAADEGVSGGTPGYVAPEQARGEPVDARADVFSFGAVLREIAPDPPAPLAALIARCVEPDRDRRAGSMPQVVGDLDAIVEQRRPPDLRLRALVRRPAVIAALAAFAALAAGAGWFQYRAAAQARWAHEVAAPEIRRLSAAGDVAAAFLLAHEARQVRPQDPVIEQLWLDVSVPIPVVLTSDPEGADVLLSTYRTPSAAWLPLGRTPLRGVRIPRGLSRIRMVKAGFEPFDGTYYPHPQMTVRLDPAGTTPAGMVRVSGGRDAVRFGDVRAVADFWIDRYEVTNRAFKAFVDGGGYRNQSYWREPFVDGGARLAWDAAIARFVDRSGKPGPATWTNGSYPEGQGDFPVGGVSWYEAAAYARYAGKALPTMYQWYRAAALGRFADILPLSNFNGAGPARVGAHAGLGTFGTFDMAGNVKEWCWNESGDRRFALGGAWDEPRYMFADYDARPPFDRAANLGFRLAKHDGPVSAAELAPASPLAHRIAKPRPPVGDDIFAVYRRQYAFDPSPLNAVVEEEERTEMWTRINVTFDAAYGGERMRAHLFLPIAGRPPYQTVVLFGGSDAFRLRSSRDMSLSSAEVLVRSGRALLYPVYKGTYERQAPELMGTNARRELRIAWYRDLARAIDYLETRPDIDRTRLAFYGTSAGGDAGVMLTALESRFKASILQGTGLQEESTPEIDLRNYAPRVRVPTLLLAGRYDFEVPYEAAQKPLFELLGPAPEHKRLVSVESGHTVPANELLGTVLPWLDRYLGPVAR
ncbi:MAG TPA: protein kinase [Vicinamibacterales bacterium]|nr:protein kinase [Vicinamibacterales bacterium]